MWNIWKKELSIPLQQPAFIIKHLFIRPKALIYGKERFRSFLKWFLDFKCGLKFALPIPSVPLELLEIFGALSASQTFHWAWQSIFDPEFPLTFIHENKGELIFGFPIFELGCVHPFVISTEILDYQFHETFLCDKVDFVCLCKTKKIGKTEEFFWVELFQGQILAQHLLQQYSINFVSVSLQTCLILQDIEGNALCCAMLWDSSIIYVCRNGRIASSREKASVKPPNTKHSSLLDITELKPEYLGFLVAWKCCTSLQSVMCNSMFGQDEEYFAPLAEVQVPLGLLHPLHTNIIVLPHCPVCSEQILSFQRAWQMLFIVHIRVSSPVERRQILEEIKPWINLLHVDLTPPTQHWRLQTALAWSCPLFWGSWLLSGHCCSALSWQPMIDICASFSTVLPSGPLIPSIF